MTNLNEPSKEYSLRQFSQLCVYGLTLRRFANKAIEEFQDYYGNSPYTYLFPSNKLLNHQIHKYIKNLELFQRLHKGDANTFKLMSTYENTGPFAVTNVLFYPAIEYLGSKEQYNYFSKLIQDGRIVGSYAQTEIGHGSDIQNLQTSATFDPNKKCFILNTPGTGAVKYWPAALGLFATHIITQAGLFVNGKSHGIQTFIIQIRDPQTLKTLQGVNIGEIGPKLGFRHIDNGFLQFCNFEVALDSLLSRYIQVDNQGKVTKSEDKNSLKIMYGSMMTLRGGLFRYFTALISRSLQATHSYLKKTQIKQTEARKNLDELANYFSFVLSTRYMRELFEEFFSCYHTNTTKALGMLKEIHFATTGFKVLSSCEVIRVSRERATIIDIGNLVLNGVVQQYAEAVPTSTFEGDNTVMLLQVIRIALAFYKDLMMGDSIQGAMSFLNKYQKYATEGLEFNLTIEVKNTDDLNENLEKLIENFIYKSLQELAQKIQKAVFEEGIPLEIVISDKMQTGIINLSLRLFEFINYQIALKTYHDEKVKVLLSLHDMELIGKLMKLQRINYFKAKINEIINSGVLKYTPNILDEIEEIRESIYQSLLSELDYIFSQTLFDKNELSSLEDFKSINHDEYANLKEKITEVKKQVHLHINKLSKL